MLSRAPRGGNVCQGKRLGLVWVVGKWLVLSWDAGGCINCKIHQSSKTKTIYTNLQTHYVSVFKKRNCDACWLSQSFWKFEFQPPLWHTALRWIFRLLLPPPALLSADLYITTLTGSTCSVCCIQTTLRDKNTAHAGEVSTFYSRELRV